MIENISYRVSRSYCEKPAMWFLVFVAAAALALTLVLQSLRRAAQYYTHLVVNVNKLPGPENELPFPIGSYFGTAPDHAGRFRQLRMQHINHGQKLPSGLSRFWIGPRPFVMVSKGETAERILSTTRYIDKGDEYNQLHDWLGTGLLTSSRDKWFVRRKFLTPAFHFHILNEYLEVFYEQSSILCDRLRPNAVGGVEFDIVPYISRCTLDIICETAMGKKLHAQTSNDSAYVNAVYRMTDLVSERMANPPWHFRTIYLLLGPGRKYYRTLKILHDFANDVIAERRAKLQKEGLSGRRNSTRHIPFLDMLLQAKSEDGTALDDADIREEVDTFMFEGHDTTSSAASSTIFLLGCHQESQEKLRAEVDGLFGQSNRSPTAEDLKNLPYLECVLKESMRLFPPVPLIDRKIHEDMVVDGHIVPKGSSCVLPIFALHRDPEVFSNPDEFIPERFLENNNKYRSPFDYIPFSAGPRNCIGQRFALLEEKTVLSTIIRNFTVKSAESLQDFEVQGELVTRPVNGVRVMLTPRPRFQGDPRLRTL